MGYYYDESGKGIRGENLGFDKYLSFSAKIYQIKSPLLKELDISPFLHTNIALAPNRNPND